MLGSKDIFLDRAKRELSVMQMNHCGIQECEKGHMWQFQARPYHLLHFVLHGEGSLKISGRMLNVHAGQAFFIPAGIEGKYIASLQNPWKYAWIGFYADNGNKFIDLLFGKNEILDLALPAKELEKEILSILSVMDKRLQDVAGILHVHPNYLSTLFRREYDQSPREYLRKVRMNQAKLLLATTEYSISDISSDVGYTNPFQFSKVFKSCYGISPTEYRNMRQ